MFNLSAMSMHTPPASLWLVLYLLWLLGSCLYILQQRRPPTATLAWLIAFMSLPLVSAVIYFFLGPRRLRRRRLRRRLAKLLAARAVVPVMPPALPDRLAGRAWLAALARVPCASGDAPPRMCERLTLLKGGDEAFTAIERAVTEARASVHLEYYIFEPDEVGTRLRDLLVARARAGLQIRVLVDALGSQHARPAFWAPLRAAGGEVRLFNPLRLLRLQSGRVNFRTHRKIVVVDGLHAFTGGINISAGNSALSSGGTAWRDTHVEIVGAPALDLQVVFLEDWLYAGDESLSADAAGQPRDRLLAQAAAWFPPPPRADGPWVQIIDSGPDEPDSDIHRFYFSAIAQARRRLWITTPYFVPDDAILLALTTAAARGVDVRVILPRKGDSWLVTAAASTFADEAVAGGVPVFEYVGRMIHAKTMVVDDELAVVGTANLDNRSFRLNFEVIAAIYDRGVAAELADLFMQDLACCEPVARRRTDTSAVRQILASAARLLAPVL